MKILSQWPVARRHRRMAQLRRAAKRRRADFLDVLVADDGHARLAVRRQAVRRAAGRFVTKRQFQILLRCLSVCCLMILALPLILMTDFMLPILQVFQVSRFDAQDMNNYFIALGVCFMVSAVPSVLLSERFLMLGSMWGVFSPFLLIALGFPLVGTHPEVVLGSVASFAMMILATLVAVISDWIDSLQEAEFVDTLLLDSLIAAALVIHRARNWLDLVERRKAAENLERAGFLASRGLSRLLKLDNAETTQWLRERGDALAGTLNGLARAVLWPQSDTREYVFLELRRIASCILRGNWTEAENPNLSNLARPGRAAQFKAMLLQLFFGLLPLLALGCLRLIEIPLPSPIESSIALGAYLWAVVSLLVVLDPLLEKRLSTIRSAVHLLKGKSE
jgi:hypothetical protein